MKKLYSTILVLATMVAALSLTACGGSDDNDEIGGDSDGSAIHFDSQREDYATYIDATKCIIFNYMKDEIYKISTVGTVDKI